MNLNLKKHKSDLLFLPLGGAGEIGMNMNFYQLDGKWLMVDFGAGFAEDFLPGVDMILPDITAIEEYKKSILGLVLTHAHEDHLGAIIYLWDNFDCPIYATPFTAAFLRAKLADSNNRKNVKIIEVAPNSQFSIGPFAIELVQITHSVPEMNALLIKTKYGNIFHSGDWKLDPNPLIGKATDGTRISNYGDEGVLAYVGDSTNVFSPGKSGSEGDLRESLIQLIGSCKKMVLVTTFASNVARIESIVRAAEACGRRVVLAGRSLWRIVNAAQESGYLKDLEHEFVNEDSFNKYPRDKILVISTGCQGEVLAATNKIVNNDHRHVKMVPGDTVIFSSKIIPGNDKRIFRLFNKFVSMGVNVLTEKNSFVHVSGHPNREDLKEMYSWVRPQIAIPVHGEIAHMNEHAKLAKEWGVKHVLQVANGDVVKLAPGDPVKVGMVESGILAIDGKMLLPPDSHIMRMRRRMRTDGIVVVMVLLDKLGLVSEPVITAPGVLDPVEDKEILLSIEEELTEALDSNLAGKRRATDERLEQVIRTIVKKTIKSEVGKYPGVEVIIKNLD